METFIPAREFAPSPGFAAQRDQALAKLDLEAIDRPIRRLVNAWAGLPHCFTLQSCWGHFTGPGRQDPLNTLPLAPEREAAVLTWRIAYLAVCVQPGAPGAELRRGLEALAEKDPAHVQFGCALWFWERHPNSYVVQLTPARFRYQDTALVNLDQARALERSRPGFFAALARLARLAQEGRG